MEAIINSVSTVLRETVDTDARLSEEQPAAVSVRLGQSNRTFVTDAVRSGLVLRMIAMKLIHLCLSVHAGVGAIVPVVGEDDPLLVTSGSGAPTGGVKAAKTGTTARARIAVLAAKSGPSLADLTNVVVVTAHQETCHGSRTRSQGSLGRHQLAHLPDFWRKSAAPETPQALPRKQIPTRFRKAAR